VPADFFGGTRGRLLILPNGTVMVDVASELSSAEAFVSFDGVSFVL